MRYSNKLILSTTTAVALLMSGCVKPADQVTPSGTTTGNVVYENTTGGTYQPNVIYEEGAPIVYEDPAASSGTYVTGTTTEINTGGYVPTGNSAYDTSSGAYGAPTSTTGGTYTDPYAASSSSTGGYTPPVTYTQDTPYVGGSTPYVGGGIQLQVAAVRDNAAAQQYASSLSLDPKYSAYVQPAGNVNRVIVSGFSSRSEALALRDRQFPDGFIVSGSDTAGSNVATPSSYSGSVGSTSSRVGVQVGAFGSQSTAQAAAESAAMGRYTAVTKAVTVNGRTVYKAIVLGFASSSDARSAIASGQFGGDAFVVTYP